MAFFMHALLTKNSFFAGFRAKATMAPKLRGEFTRLLFSLLSANSLAFTKLSSAHTAKRLNKAISPGNMKGTDAITPPVVGLKF